MYSGPHCPLNVRMGRYQEPLSGKEMRLLQRAAHIMFTVRKTVNKISKVN